jgi:C4-dicarboxylate transporter, DctM subunit
MIGLGFDPVWFGIVLVILLEIGMITPPIGLNLFVIQKMAGSDGTFGDVARGSLPFVLLMLLGILIFCIWPQLVLWLPAQT